MENNSAKDQEVTKDKKVENLYSNNIIKNEAGNLLVYIDKDQF